MFTWLSFHIQSLLSTISCTYKLPYYSSSPAIMRRIFSMEDHDVKIHIFLPSLFYWQFSSVQSPHPWQAKIRERYTKENTLKDSTLIKRNSIWNKKEYALNNISAWKILSVETLPRNLMRFQGCYISYLQVSSDFSYIW